MANAEEQQSYLETLEAELEETNRGLVALTMELEQAKEQFRNIFENSVQGIFRVGLDGRFKLANPSFAHLMGFETEAELMASLPDAASIYADPDRHGELLKRLQTERVVRGFVSPVRRPDGEIILILEDVRRTHDAEGRVNGYESLAEDITHQREIEERLELVANVFEHSIEGIVITDANTKILEVNKAFEKITRYKPEEVLGQKTTLLRSEWHDKPFYKHMWSCIMKDGIWQGEITDRRKNGEIYVQWLTICAIKDAEGTITNFIGIFNDITAKKETEEKIHQLAYYDHLTKLPNRTLFHDRLGQAIRNAKRDNNRLAVLFIDLDNFKNINDTLGHLVGDKFLIQVSETLNECVRDQDTVSRLGGDEFVILLEELKGSQDASRVAKLILADMSTPFVIDGNEVFSGASIGISVFPEDGDDPDTLVKHADTAMYSAKDEGKNDFRFFIDDMNVRTFERVRMENDLRRAIEEQEFVLYYQPRLTLTDEKIIGAEALIRWKHPDFGLVAPFKFIPLAEETGIIDPITDWVLAEAFRQVRAWQEAGITPPTIAINLSAREMRRPTIAEDVIRLLQDHRLNPSCIELELTESAVMTDAEEAIKILWKLKNEGLRISVDDFGTGYSSLSYLTRLPIDTVKIDKSFIHAMDQGKEGRLIVEAIIALSHRLNLTVVAEGVEKREQADFLKDQGCDEVQGFLFHKPLPPDLFVKVL